MSESQSKKDALRTIAQDAINAAEVDVCGSQIGAVDSPLHVDVLDDDEQRLVTMYRRAQQERPQTASMMLDFVSLYGEAAHGWYERGSFQFSDPKALEKWVSREALRRIDPLSAAGPEEETMLKCLRTLDSKHGYSLLHAAMTIFLCQVECIPESQFGIHWWMDAQDEGPYLAAINQCFHKATELIESGEYLRSL